MNFLQKIIADNFYNHYRSLLIAEDDYTKREFLIYNLCRYIEENINKTVLVTAPTMRHINILIDDMTNLGYNFIKNINYSKLAYNNNIVYFLPCCNGDKVRGYRANYLIIDDTCIIPYEIFTKISMGYLDLKILLADNRSTIQHRLIVGANSADYYIGCIW